jgi:hypothetical protein
MRALLLILLIFIISYQPSVASGLEDDVRVEYPLEMDQEISEVEQQKKVRSDFFYIENEETKVESEKSAMVSDELTTKLLRDLENVREISETVKKRSAIKTFFLGGDKPGAIALLKSVGVAKTSLSDMKKILTGSDNDIEMYEKEIEESLKLAEDQVAKKSIFGKIIDFFASLFN